MRAAKVSKKVLIPLSGHMLNELFKMVENRFCVHGCKVLIPLSGHMLNEFEKQSEED